MILTPAGRPEGSIMGGLIWGYYRTYFSLTVGCLTVSIAYYYCYGSERSVVQERGRNVV